MVFACSINSKDRDYEYQSIKIEQDVSYTWPLSSLTGVINSAFNFVKSSTYSLFEDIGRVGFGSTNYRVENPLMQAVNFLEEAIKLDDMYSCSNSRYKR